MSADQKDWDIIDFATKVSSFVEKNFKPIALAVVVVILAAGGVVFRNQMIKSSEQDAYAKLAPVMGEYKKQKEQFIQSEEKIAKNQDTKSVGSKKTGDLTADYGVVVSQLEKFIVDNPGKSATIEAALVLSDLYGEYQSPEQGAEVLEKLNLDGRSSSLLTQVALLRAGDLWATAKNCEKAVNSWQKATRHKSFVESSAKIKLGVCLQELGRFDEAKATFEEVSSQSPNTMEGMSAKQYLKYIEFRVSHPQAPSQGQAEAQQSKQKAS